MEVAPLPPPRRVLHPLRGTANPCPAGSERFCRNLRQGVQSVPAYTACRIEFLFSCSLGLVLKIRKERTNKKAPQPWELHCP